MARLSLSLLGPFQVTLDGEPVTSFESNKVRALLAYLAVEADRPHRRDSLAALFWPDWPDRAARSNLRHALPNLRKAIGDRRHSPPSGMAPVGRTAAIGGAGKSPPFVPLAQRPGKRSDGGDRHARPPFLLITRETIQFNTASDYWVDVTAFSALVQADEAGQTAIRQLEEATALYRGHFLEGFFVKGCRAFEDWSLLLRERLHRQALTALHRLAGHYEQRGEYERACECARRQIALEPWQEEAHQQLMRLLALSGQRSAALAQYETCLGLLAEELGVEPAAETTKLYEQIRDGELEVPAPPSAPHPRPPHNLPASLIPFVGREAELAEIEDRLQDPACRLLTLVGPGGSGKTRLAVEAAADVIDRFAHGVYFVPLAPLQSAEAIVPATAQALGLPFSGEAEPQQQLLDYLRSKQMLLILDNFEHLIEGAGIVTDILKAAHNTRVLATSRARLGVRGEHLFQVDGMDCPAFPERPVSDQGQPEDVSWYSAVQFFLQSAARAQAGFEPSGDDLAHVARICGLVEGMPLGILLAAAWMEMLSPAEIAMEIQKSLDFLETEWRDVPERQRSLRAVFDRSWNLLAEREREVFRQLSVFRGGFTRQAAEEVSGATLRELMGLMHKSFLQRTPAGRYEVHELLRQYASEKLAQSELEGTAAHDRHSSHYAAALERWAGDLKGPQQQAASSEMQAEGENLRLAWYWAVEQRRVERLEQAMEGLMEFYWLLGWYKEGEAAMRAAASTLAAAAQQPSADAAGRLWAAARALIWQSNFCRVLGRAAQASELQAQAQALLDGPELAHQDTLFERALLLQTIGRTVLLSDYEQGGELLERALALYRELDDRWRAANVLEALGRASYHSGAAVEARQRFEEALALFRELGDQSGSGRVTAWLALVAVYQGRFEEAEHLARRALRRLGERGNPTELNQGQAFLGYTLEGVGKFDEARTVLEECLGTWGDRGRPDWAAAVPAALSWVNLHLGRYPHARGHAQTGLALARESGPPYVLGDTLLALGSVALAEGAYAEASKALQQGADTLEQIGQKDGLSEAAAFLGCAARGLGQVRQAKLHLAKALRLGEESGSVPALLWALAMIALLLVDQGESERAVELYALAERYPFVANSRWFEHVAGRHIAAVGAGLPPDIAAAARERGRARVLQATVAELLVELGE